MKKSFLNGVAGFAIGMLLTGWAFTTNDNSAQDAAEYASKTCPVVQR